MIIKKEYKFYAGHRNQDLKDKCFRPHGHQYFLSIFFEVVRNGSVTTLFSDFDNIIEPWIKDKFDHRFLLDENDDLAKTFVLHKEKFSEDLGECLVPFPTSVENISFFIFYYLNKIFKFNVQKIELKETSSSTIIYFMNDFLTDLKSSIGEKLMKSLMKELQVSADHYFKKM